MRRGTDHFSKPARLQIEQNLAFLNNTICNTPKGYRVKQACQAVLQQAMGR